MAFVALSARESPGRGGERECQFDFCGRKDISDSLLGSFSHFWKVWGEVRHLWGLRVFAELPLARLTEPFPFFMFPPSQSLHMPTSRVWSAAHGGATNGGFRGVWPPFLEIGIVAPCG